MTCGVYVIEWANLAATRDGRGKRSDVILEASDSRCQPPPCGWVNLILLFTADHRPLRDKQKYDAVCRPKVRVPRSSAAIGRGGIALAS
jgi:hypothetical protein